MIFLDTDHFTIAANNSYSQHVSLVTRLKAVEEPVCLPVVVIEEQLRGWLAKIHHARKEVDRIDAYDRLVNLVLVLRRWEIVRWNNPAADEFARLKAVRCGIGTQDLRIAALALTHDAVLLTRNARHFSRVPGLRFESWID